MNKVSKHEAKPKSTKRKQRITIVMGDFRIPLSVIGRQRGKLKLVKIQALIPQPIHWSYQQALDPPPITTEYALFQVNVKD